MEVRGKLESLKAARILGGEFTYGDGAWRYRYKDGMLEARLTLRGYIKRRGTLSKWLQWFAAPQQERGVISMYEQGILRWVRRASPTASQASPLASSAETATPLSRLSDPL